MHYPTQDAKIDTIVRVGTVWDQPFIINSWASQMELQYPNSFAMDFRRNFSDYARELIKKSMVLVSCLDDDEDEIISYLVYTSFRGNQVIHWAYTKLDGRGQGKVRELLELSNPTSLPVVFTHSPKNSNNMRHFCKKYIFDPNIMRLL